ncbi:uncharacterized protein LOC129959082 isoform X7 [Argiope bruennichi]|uniref:uncharacterized protein LOC129959082 isoform X7 n=1 Tax=Argiope bruennichi TaxID=94029 RepID=UPI0024959CCF|nr:uncharacterized protein LOC129959082 isoform X7 [Argiope bruennichi]
MSYSSISDDIPFEGRDISVEEFWKTEILSSYNSKIDLDFIAVSNRDLHPLTVHIEFRKFLGFVNDALHKDVFRDLLMPVFRHLYLLLLSSKGKSEAVKFYRSYSYLFSSSDGLQDLLKCETCEDAQVFLKSLSRMRVKLSKRAYTTLSNWLKGNFSESSEMFNIPRVLHENFHIDIYNGKEEEALFLDEKKILEKVQSLNKNFQIPEAPKNSEHKTKDTAKASSKIQTGETQRARKKYEPKADTCKATKKDSKKAYLEKVKNSGKSIEEMVEALLNPPDSFDDSSSVTENSDQIMNSDEDPGEEDPGKKIIEDDTGEPLGEVTENSDLIMNSDEDPGEEDPGKKIIEDDTGEPLGEVTENSDLIMNSDKDPGEEDPGKKIIEDDTGEPLGEVTENSDLIMNSDEDPGEEDPGKKIIEDDTGEPLGEVTENSDLIMNSDEDPGEEDPGKKIIEDDTGEPLGEVTENSDLIMNSDEDPGEEDPGKKIIEDDTGEPLGEENSDLIMNSDEDPGEEDPGKKIIEDDTGEPLGEDGVQRGRHYKIQPQRFQLPDNYKTNFHRSLAYTISGKDIVCSSDISPDLLYMAVGFENCKIRTWRFINNNTKFQPIGTLVGHEKIVCALSIDSNRKCLISGSHDYSVKIWDIEKSICMKSLKPHSAPVLDVCISPNSRYFVSASEDRNICLFWYDESYPIKIYSGHSLQANTRVRFHPNGVYFASASTDGNVFLFKVTVDSYPVRMFHKHKTRVYALAFSPCGKCLATADIDGALIIWDILNCSPFKIIYSGQGIRDMSYDRSGNFLIALVYCQAWKIFNVEGDNNSLLFQVETSGVPRSLRFSADNTMYIIQHTEARPETIFEKGLITTVE